jgi:dCTP deaminase
MYLGTKKIIELNAASNIVDGFDDSRVVCGAYELALGQEVFRTDSKDKTKEFLKPNEKVTINPGQFALLLSEETIHVPIDKIAFISIKAGIKLKGLVNVSGFHVDPGFKGNLLFSVYNAGSSPISLLRGERCFLIWFAELQVTAQETTSYQSGNHDHKNQSTIPGKYIDALMAGELASPNALSKRIDDNKRDIEHRLGLVEKEQTAKDYLVKTAVGLGIVIVLKFILDWTIYDSGYKKGMEFKAIEVKNDSLINDMLVERRRLLREVDSLKNVKTLME